MINFCLLFKLDFRLAPVKIVYYPYHCLKLMRYFLLEKRCFNGACIGCILQILFPISYLQILLQFMCKFPEIVFFQMRFAVWSWVQAALVGFIFISTYCILRLLPFATIQQFHFVCWY